MQAAVCIRFFLLLIADESQEKMIDRLHNRNKRFSNMQNHRYPNSGMGISAGVYILKTIKWTSSLQSKMPILHGKMQKIPGRGYYPV